MLMQVNSGLTRYEVQKAKLTVQPDLHVHNAHMTIVPALLLLLGGASILEVTIGSDLAIVMLVLLSLLGVGASMIVRRVLQEFANAHKEVLVIREGLIRPRPVGALVPGDTILLPAGSVVPVDVALSAQQATITGPLAWVLAALRVATPHDQVIAGSRITTEVQAQVLAVGAQRFAVARLMPFLTAKSGVEVRTVLSGLVALCKLQFRASWTQLGMRLAHLGQLAVSTTQQFQVRIDRFNDHTTLVGQLRQRAKEVAFRYNQDPVSSRWI
jgi:hypothetical protein